MRRCGLALLVGRLLPVAHRHDHQGRPAAGGGRVVGALDRGRDVLGLGGRLDGHGIRPREAVEPAGEEGLEGEVPAVLLADDDDQRRPVHARGREPADRRAEPCGRVQQDERRLVPADRVAARHPDDRALVQAEHEADVLRQAGEERDLRRPRVREHRRQAAPAEEVERRVADVHPQTSSATSTIRRSFAACCSTVSVVALDRRGEAALRREAELLDVDELRRLVDPPLQLVLRLELAELGGDEAEHDGLALRQEAQRLEAARALVVLLQEEAVDLELVEERLGDEVVAAFGDPDDLKLPRHRWVVTAIPRAGRRAPR